MSRLKNFIKTSLLGGVSVILPAALSLFIFKWLINIITDFIQPLTNLIVFKSHLQEFIATAVVIFIILTVCFVVGVIVRTRGGKFIQEGLENRILKIAPGYSIIKETVMQFVGRKKATFSSVALVQPYENDTLMTGFVTDKHADGLYSVFVPTGPNPTTGYIFHLKRQYVHPVDVSIEEAIKIVISCGVGSGKLFKAFSEKMNSRPSAI
jgi:uncharacterized membrane protein